MQKAMNFNDVAIVSVEGSDYRIHFRVYEQKWCNKYNEKLQQKWKIWIIIIFLLYIKINKSTYYQRNRDYILNRTKDYYKNDKERLRDNSRDKYRNLSEEKNKKREYGKNRSHNMSEKKKQKLKEYQKNYCEAKKSPLSNQ